MIKPDRLLFGTAGIPLGTKGRGTLAGIKQVNSLGLDGMELEFVRGINISSEQAPLVKKVAADEGVILTAHAPYYINLNSDDISKKKASIMRIVDTARIASLCGAYSITFHAGFFMGISKEQVYLAIEESIREIMRILDDEGISIWIRPETTGKDSQFGSLQEIISLGKTFPRLLPCVDFSHLHARAGKQNSFSEFGETLSLIESELGKKALENMHMHLSGIEYGQKGEKRHLNLKESDMNYQDLAKALKNFKVKGIIISESPNIESDSLLFRDTYSSL
jgi:deoxyribonuclease IV